MRNALKPLFPTMAALLIALAGGQAQANVTFNFNGASGESATLVLSGYTLGQTFDLSNFVSFNLQIPDSLGATLPWAPVDLAVASGSFSGLNLTNLGFSGLNIVTSGVNISGAEYWFFDGPQNGHAFEFGHTACVPVPVPDPNPDNIKPGTCNDVTTLVSGAGTWNTAAVQVAPTDPSQIPEPGSLLLVGAAVAALGLVRRRKA